MQVVPVTGGYRLLVPQGAKIRRVGAQIIVEEDKEYFSRRFYELSKELEDLKSQVKQLQEQINELKEKASKEKAKAL
jgi:peptidoglycan hydrolase CwlO-like protein